jgi:pimeloyl-ACP methyl ester carboxylesterase
VHGLCLNDLQWTRKDHDLGTALAHTLKYTPVYVHYNAGLHTSVNGRAFAALIETLLEQWPAPLKELLVLAHSMGGLVCRSAYYYGMAAGQVWPQHLSKLIFLGTPHHGALLERGGNWVNHCLGLSPYIAPFFCAFGQTTQRWHYRLALWQSARRRLARFGSLRACGRSAASGTTAGRG